MPNSRMTVLGISERCKLVLLRTSGLARNATAHGYNAAGEPPYEQLANQS